MPVPQGSIIFAGALSKLPPEFQKSHSPLMDFMKNFCNDLSKAWATWHSGLLGGGNTVTGLGIGAWVGVGEDGNLIQTVPFDIIHTWSKSDPDGYWNTFKSALTAAFKEKFANYASTFKFGTVPYTGTCSATPLSPGPFSAVNTPGPLLIYKASAQTPKNIGDSVRQRLPSKWAENKDPLDKWLKAIEGSVDEQFIIWEATSMFSGDTAIGVALPGAGLGKGKSLGTGKIM